MVYRRTFSIRNVPVLTYFFLSPGGKVELGNTGSEIPGPPAGSSAHSLANGTADHRHDARGLCPCRASRDHGRVKHWPVMRAQQGGHCRKMFVASSSNLLILVARAPTRISSVDLASPGTVLPQKIVLKHLLFRRCKFESDLSESHPLKSRSFIAATER